MRPALRDDLVAVGFPEAATAPDDYVEALAASLVGSSRLAGLHFRRAFEPALVLGDGESEDVDDEEEDELADLVHLLLHRIDRRVEEELDRRIGVKA